MSKRCILISPEFHNVETIEELRRKYDPQAKHVEPHITLVFPFESDITEDELRKHIIKAVSGFKSFELKLQGVTGTSFAFQGRTDYCVFLNVKQGNDKIIELHDRLYTGILEKHLLREMGYHPHITLGKMDDFDTYQKAVDETKGFDEAFRTRVNKINIEIIDESEDSHLDFSVSLY